MALSAYKKTMIKNMAIGAGVLVVVLMLPTIGPKVQAVIDSVKAKIGG